MYLDRPTLKFTRVQPEMTSFNEMNLCYELECFT